MHNMVSLRCAKGVQNLWKHRSKTCAHLSTGSVDNKSHPPKARVQLPVIRRIVPTLPQRLPTPIITHFHLLIHSYPHNPHPLLLTPPNEI